MNFDITALTLIDYAAILVLLVSGGLATLRGMTRELMGLIGWPIAIIAAKVSAPYLQPTLAEAIKIEGISEALAWGVPFVIVVVLWFAFSSLVSPGLSKAGLGGLDRWLRIPVRTDPGFCDRTADLYRRGCRTRGRGQASLDGR